MPNHCANSLKLTANTPEALKLLDAIRAEITAGRGFFHAIDPCPEELQETRAGFPRDDREAANIKKYGFAHWYDFQVARWGTKWNAYEIHTLADEKNTLMLEFETAWSPPTGIYETLHARGFDVEATYCEQGCDFVGYWKNGTDHTDKLSAAVPQVYQDHEETINAYEPLENYFTAQGINHFPPHFGG